MKLNTNSLPKWSIVGTFGVLAVLIVLYFRWVSDNWTGADAARAAQGGCPDGYVTAPTTGTAIVGGKTAIVYGSTCVVKVKP